MSKNCEEFQKIEDEFNEKIEEFQRNYAKVKEKGNVNLDGGKSFFEELERFKYEIIEKSEKLTAKTPEDINAETRIYLGGFEIVDEEIFENLENPLFINEKIDLYYSEDIKRIPPNLVFNEYVDFQSCTSLTKISENVVFNNQAYFNACTSLTEISENVVFNGGAYFQYCTSLSDETIEQLKQMKKTGKIKGELILPDGTLIS